jgi:hypothetical protein
MCAAVRAFFVIDLPPRPMITPTDGSDPRHPDGCHARCSEGLGLALASHSSWVPPTSGIVDGQDAEDVLHYPNLRPGDLVFAVSERSRWRPLQTCPFTPELQWQ